MPCDLRTDHVALFFIFNMSETDFIYLLWKEKIVVVCSIIDALYNNRYIIEKYSFPFYNSLLKFQLFLVIIN